ncbi:hypothetical protein [uncultured Limosilactobacillus sp.]|uniref:hypothetical protein n=1 Tax=uncultured Limosilactobacillus sp. TaxID=2837629 RepID=UPI0025DDF47C|nr:hypothetical protein [uncultured Limosilactobacillus sp.]
MADPLNILHTIGFDHLYPIVRAEIEISAPLDHDRLINAVDRVHHIIPELMQKYNLSNNQFLGGNFVLNDVLHFENTHQEKAAAKLDWERQPQWAIYVTPKKLVIYGSHILFDGAGFKELLYLLCQEYNSTDEIKIVNHQDINGIQQLIQCVRPSASNNDHPAQALFMPELANQQKSQIQYRVVKQKLTTQELTRLHSKTKQAGVTLNDVLMAAFGKTIQQYCGVDEINLACPTDMRQYLPIEEQRQLRVQNLTGRYNISVSAPLNESLFETTKKVHQAMSREKEHYSFLESFRPMLKNLANGATVQQLQADVEQNYHVREIAYTNLAVVDDRRLHFAGTTTQGVVLSGGFRQLPHYQICVSTFQSQLSLVANVIGASSEIKLVASAMTMMRLYLLNY